LWWLGLPLLVMPLPAITMAVFGMWRFRKATWPTDMSWYQVLIFTEAVALLLLLCSGFVAEAYFRRWHGFPRLAGTLIISGCLLISLDEVVLARSASVLRTCFHLLHDQGPLWIVAITALLYLRLSRRVRNTFGGPTDAPVRRGLAGILLDGPRDWGGGVWLVVGASIVMLLIQASEIPALIGASMPQRDGYSDVFANGPHAPGTVGALLHAAAHAAEAYAPWARVELAQHVIGAILATSCLVLFARRARTTPLIFLGAALLLVTAAITAKMSSDLRVASSAVYHDGSPPGESLASMLIFVVLACSALALPAVRRRWR
jgi:hypothetical protein